MAIYARLKEISSIYHNNKTITAIYKGANLLWEAVTSCFGKGYWVKTSSWSNVDGWKNND